jgi:hypothetical protein
MLLGQMSLVLTERTPERPIWRSDLRSNTTIVPILGATLGTLLLGL